MKAHPLPARAALLAFAVAAPLADRGLCQVLTPPPPRPFESALGERRDVVRFAAIGDYGDDTPEEGDVAKLVAALDPDFVITLGDNNYDNGEASTIDVNIGKYYNAFIHPYAGVFGAGAVKNRFFPSLGNHDWNTPGAIPYLQYFTLPGNERYYDFVNGPVRFFALDLDPNEPDGVFPASVQGQWLQSKLAAAQEPFKVVYHHFPPHSSSDHGDVFWAQWPYKDWGATLVLTGHDHVYERLTVGGFPYVVNGIGGRPLYDFHEPTAGSEARFNADFGAVIVDATAKAMLVQAVTRAGIVVDSTTLTPDPAWFQETVLVAKNAGWKYWDLGSFPGGTWAQPGFNDAGWSSGNAQLGYGDGDEATVLGFGPNRSNKYVTAYFRRTFDVSSPSAFSQVRIHFTRDDGAACYVNGVEVGRSNLPSGPLTMGTLASSSVADAQESCMYEIVLPPSVLLTGTNLIAFEVHQVDPASSDLSFAAEVVGWSGDTVLTPRGAVWRYWDQGPVSNGWFGASFDDSSWPQGPAQLGYGDGDEATSLGYGGDPLDKHVTAYFRREFQVVNPAQFKTLVLRLLRDDGAVVYLNGREVHRSNVPLGVLAFTTRAGFAVAGLDESAFRESRIDPGLLVSGTNVLAVEIHQSSPASSDLSFDLELLGL